MSLVSVPSWDEFTQPSLLFFVFPLYIDVEKARTKSRGLDRARQRVRREDRGPQARADPVVAAALHIVLDAAAHQGEDLPVLGGDGKLCGLEIEQLGHLERINERTNERTLQKRGRPPPRQYRQHENKRNKQTQGGGHKLLQATTGRSEVGGVGEGEGEGKGGAFASAELFIRYDTMRYRGASRYTAS